MNGMSCESVVAIPQDLYNSLLLYASADARRRYESFRVLGTCTNVIPQPDVVPCSGWKRLVDLSVIPGSTLSTSSVPITSTGAATTSATGSGDGGGAAVWPYIVGAIVAVLVLGGVIAGVVVFLRRRRLASIAYTPLNTMAPETARPSFDGDW